MNGKEIVSDKLDQKVLATCNCGAPDKTVTFRNLKNRWPHCKKCHQPMKVKSNAVSSVQATDRMGYPRRIPESE